MFGGIEASKRTLKYLDPFQATNNKKYEEYQFRTYANAALSERFTFDAQYLLEYFRLPFPSGQPNLQDITITHWLPMNLRYFDPSGAFAKLGVTYVNQQYQDQASNPGKALSEFTLVDTAIGFRLPARRGVVSFEVRNLLDQSFNFSGFHALNRAVDSAEPPLFFPERTVLARFTLAID